MIADRDKARSLAASAVLAVILLASSTLGLIQQSVSYPTPALRLAFVPNDVVNLLVGVPILITSAYLTLAAKSPWDIAGLLLLPGALAYHLYSSLTYALAIPPSSGAVFILQLAAVFVSLLALWVICPALDGAAVKAHMLHNARDADPSPPIKFGGAILTILGALFLVRALGMMLGNDSSGPMDEAELAVCAADAVVGPAWIWGGAELYRGRAAGYALGFGLLFQASALFVALVLILVVRPFLIPETTFVSTDVAFVAAMGLTVTIPFVRFLRIVLRNKSNSTGVKKVN